LLGFELVLSLTAYTKPSPAKMGYSVDTRLTGRMIRLSTWAEHRVFVTLYPITSRLCAAPPSFLSSNGDYVTSPRVPAKEPKREFKVGDKIRVNLHHGKIEDAVVRAVIEDTDGTKLQVDVVGLNLTALIGWRPAEVSQMS
jgi:hypothetical protein